MKTRRLPLLLLAVLLILDLFAGCSGKDTKPVHREYTGILTNVFRPVPFEMPEGWEQTALFPPVYDPGTGEYRVLASRRTETEDADGTIRVTVDYAVVTVSLPPAGEEEAGSPVKIAQLPPVEGFRMASGAFGPDFAVWLTREDAGFTLHVFDPDAGTETTLADAQNFFPDPAGFFPQNVAVNGEGVIAVASERDVCLFGRDLRFLVSASARRYVNSLAASEDGRFWVYSEGTLSPLDETGMGNPIQMSRDWSMICGGHGYPLFACSSGGVYGFDPEAADSEPALLCDLYNSDLSGYSFFGMPDADTALFSGGLFRRAPDMDLSKIDVIEIASAEGDGFGLAALITAFNRSHETARILFTDYAQYNTETEPDAGTVRLGTDLAAGLIRPDIVIGRTWSGPMRLVYSDSLWRDLTPFMETDPLVTPDNLLGAVRSTFSTPDGGFWAVPFDYYLSLLVSGEDHGVGEGKCWTLSEFLDYAENLPADTLLMENLIGKNFLSRILPRDGMKQFFDPSRGVCDFENPDFIRLLEYCRTLPADESELARRYPEVASASRQEIYRLYQEGKIALFSGSAAENTFYLRYCKLWGGWDWHAVGYPAPEGGGISVSAGPVAALTKYSEKPELAWEFLRTVFEMNDSMTQYGNLPLLRSTWDRMAVEIENTVTAAHYDGSTESRPKDSDPLPTLDSPGVLVEAGPAETAKILAVLDSACVPIMEGMPDEVFEIVDEEFSSYIAGVSGAADCAKKIQSRVKIWMGEHSGK